MKHLSLRLFASSIAVLGLSNAYAVTPGLNWKDSYSVNGQCYCDTTYDHETGDIIVSTPQGNRTVRQICETIGPGPGANGNPIYNDVQCGNGPPNNAIDEVLCPGRVDMGSAGCDVIGPTWNLDLYFPAPVSESSGNEETGSNQSGTESNNTEQQSTEQNGTGQTNTGQTNTEQSATDQNSGEQPESIPTQSQQTDNGQTQEGSTTNTGNQETQNAETLPAGLAIAAADFSSKDDRWVLVTQSTPAADGNDPDDNHSNTALNGQYLELLPDNKVNNEDVASSMSVWPAPGQGPQVHFDVNLDRAGRYAVFVRAFSTGNFDGRLHVGFDGIWPASGGNIAVCGSKGAWQWTQCQTTPPTINIPTSGTHSIQFAAYDDGFEFDQFVLQWLSDTDVADTTATAETGSSLGNAGEPELGQAVLVGGAIGFGSYVGFFTCWLLLCLSAWYRKRGIV